MKRHAPAVARNSAAIAKVLEQELPASGTVLEIASGSGEHAVFFARRFANLRWQPSDADPDALASVAAWRAEGGSANLAPPIAIDASASDWPVTQAAAVLCINMVHIAPWEAAEGVFHGAARLLGAGAPLILYGPFLEAQMDTAPSNLAFDESLRRRDPRWGLRSLEELDQLAEQNGFERTARREMPANNLTVVWRWRGEE
ncbi:MAG: DUF938 domain-containing protein [Alteripontixanthobacter sp.]